MKFKYTASSKDGEVVEGELDAQGTAEALESLAAKGLKPVSLQIVQKPAVVTGLRLFGGKITLTDKLFLTKYLALMLRSGTDLFRSIDVLIADFEKPAIKNFLKEVRSTLEKGQPLYSAFARYPQYFSPVFVNLIKSGESSGNLETVFTNLTTSLAREQELRSKITSVLIYPLLLAGLSVLILAFLVTFSLPRIANVFLSSGFDPPLFSRIVFSVGLFVGDNIVVLLSGLAVIVVGLWYFGARTQAGRRLFRRSIETAPVIKEVVKKIALERFARTLASLMRAGVSITDAMEITADTVGHTELRDALRRVSREGLIKGLTVGEAFKRETAFPSVVTNLIAISEKAGHIDEILDTFSDFYEKEIDVSLKTVVSFVEPALLLFIGAVIGLIALSIIVPIYQLVGQF